MQVFIKSEKDNIRKPIHPGDAGYDVCAGECPNIVGTKIKGNLYSAIEYIEYDTGVSLSPSENQIFTLVYPRSSISKYNLSLANGVGVVDSGYTDTIKVRFKYHAQPSDMTIKDNKIYFKINKNKIYKKEDKIAQLVFTYHVHPQITKTNALLSTTRGLAGFGSTGQ